MEKFNIPDEFRAIAKKRGTPIKAPHNMTISEIWEFAYIQGFIDAAMTGIHRQAEKE